MLAAAPAQATETASFLKIGLGARAVGMGGAYAAIADDVNSMGWNPAGLANLTKREVSATDAELAEDTRYNFAGYAHPTKYGTLGAGVIYLSQGTIEGRTANGAPTVGYNASDLAINLNYAKKLVPDLGVGTSIRYLRSEIADAWTQSCSFDFGAQYAWTQAKGPGTPLFGLALQNVGPGMKLMNQDADLPMTIAVGTGYRLPMGLTGAMDFRQRIYSHDAEFSAGAEYALLKNFALRAGYGTAKACNTTSGGTADMNGFAVGTGINFRGLSFDYSFSPMGELGNAQRFSLAAKF